MFVLTVLRRSSVYGELVHTDWGAVDTTGFVTGSRFARQSLRTRLPRYRCDRPSLGPVRVGCRCTEGSSVLSWRVTLTRYGGRKWILGVLFGTKERERTLSEVLETSGIDQEEILVQYLILSGTSCGPSNGNVRSRSPWGGEGSIGRVCPGPLCYVRCIKGR